MTAPQQTSTGDASCVDAPPLFHVLRNHLALVVSDPHALAEWYQDVLGMEVTARRERWVFLSFGRKHHDIALIQAEPGAVRGGLGLQHYAMEIDGDMALWRRLYDRLVARNVEIVKVSDHKVGYGIYFSDPDGNRLELFHETVHDEARAKALLAEFGAPSDDIDIDDLDTGADTDTDSLRRDLP